MKKILATLSLLTISSIAFAQDNTTADGSTHYLPPRAYKPYYAGISGIMYQHSMPSGTAVSNNYGENFGLRAYGGYRFNNHVGIEVSYLDFEDEDNGASGVQGPDHTKISGGDILGKFFTPLWPSIDGYALAGLAYIHEDNYNQSVIGTTPDVDYNENHITPEIGLGMDILTYSDFSLGISLRYIWSAGSMSSFTYTPIDVNYSFG